MRTVEEDLPTNSRLVKNSTKFCKSKLLTLKQDLRFVALTYWSTRVKAAAHSCSRSCFRITWSNAINWLWPLLYCFLEVETSSFRESSSLFLSKLHTLSFYKLILKQTNNSKIKNVICYSGFVMGKITQLMAPNIKSF